MESLDLGALRSEVQRLSVLVARLQAEKIALVEENRVLKAKLIPAPAFPVQDPLQEDCRRLELELAETRKQVVSAKSECSETEDPELMLRKVQLETEMLSARKVIQDAAAIKKQLDDLERMTERLANENKELRIQRAQNGDLAALPDEMPGGYNGLSMIKTPRRAVMDAIKSAAAPTPEPAPPRTIADVPAPEPEAAPLQKKGLGSSLFRSLRRS